MVAIGLRLVDFSESEKIRSRKHSECSLVVSYIKTPGECVVGDYTVEYGRWIGFGDQNTDSYEYVVPFDSYFSMVSLYTYLEVAGNVREWYRSGEIMRTMCYRNSGSEAKV